MIETIKRLVAQDYADWKKLGNVSVKESADGEMLIFNYTPIAQYEGRWNEFEIISRGLIMSKDGVVVARPFDKFFNWGERGIPSGRVVSVYEKVDGSLGILYRHNGEYKVATRGSFDSEQALWATEFLKRYDLSELPDEYTLLFEIIYPDNRIVVDYQGREDLVLIGVRNRFTGEYLSSREMNKVADQCGFSSPIRYSFSNVSSLLDRAKDLPSNMEGYVVELSSGERWKIKGQRYLELHKAISFLSFKKAVEAERYGKTADLVANIPDEFLDEFKGWIQEIRDTVGAVKSTVELKFERAPKATKKDFALWVNSNYSSLAPYLLARWDGKDYGDIIYKREFS